MRSSFGPGGLGVFRRQKRSRSFRLPGSVTSPAVAGTVPSALKLSLERRLALGFGAAGLVLIVVTAAACWNVARFQGTHFWVEHSREVLSNLEQAASDVLGMQSSARGFVLTGSDDILASFEAGQRHLEQTLARLRALAQDNPPQRARIDRLTPLANHAREIMQGRISARRARGLDAASEADAYLEGQKAVTEVRLAIRDLVVAERRLLDDRLDRNNTAARVTLVGVLGLSGIALGLLVAAVTTIRRDLARRRETEQRIQQLNVDLARRAQQLEAANHELESFSYSVSHDLRAPLRHVDGFANLLEKHAEARLDPEARRYLGIISKSAKRMGALIDDLLKFSRIGRAPLKVQPVKHDELLAAVITDGQYISGASPIVWDIGPLPNVEADAAMLRQVWANLIENAVKYSSKTAQPRITIHGDTHRTAGEYVFFVRDNGVGFDMAYADKLFGVFQRLHEPAEFEGTGIGLAHVRRIIARHGGRAWAESSPGNGATFYFSLPAVHVAASSP